MSSALVSPSCEVHAAVNRFPLRMTLQTFAIILGIIALLIGPPFLVQPKATMAWYMMLIEDDVVLRIVAALSLILCVLALVPDPSLHGLPDGFVRVLAWMGALKSIMICWWPDWYREVSSLWYSFRWGPVFMGSLSTIMGVWLLWIAPLL